MAVRLFRYRTMALFASGVVYKLRLVGHPLFRRYLTVTGIFRRMGNQVQVGHIDYTRPPAPDGGDTGFAIAFAGSLAFARRRRRQAGALSGVPGRRAADGRAGVGAAARALLQSPQPPPAEGC